MSEFNNNEKTNPQNNENTTHTSWVRRHSVLTAVIIIVALSIINICYHAGDKDKFFQTCIDPKNPENQQACVNLCNDHGDVNGCLIACHRDKEIQACKTACDKHAEPSACGRAGFLLNEAHKDNHNFDESAYYYKACNNPQAYYVDCNIAMTGLQNYYFWHHGISAKNKKKKMVRSWLQSCKDDHGIGYIWLYNAISKGLLDDLNEFDDYDLAEMKLDLLQDACAHQFGMACYLLDKRKEACAYNYGYGCYDAVLWDHDIPDKDKINFLQKACELHNGRGCAELANIYEKGENGVTADIIKANEYNLKSCLYGGFPQDCNKINPKLMQQQIETSETTPISVTETAPVAAPAPEPTPMPLAAQVPEEAKAQTTATDNQLSARENEVLEKLKHGGALRSEYLNLFEAKMRHLIAASIEGKDSNLVISTYGFILNNPTISKCLDAIDSSSYFIDQNEKLGDETAFYIQLLSNINDENDKKDLSLIAGVLSSISICEVVNEEINGSRNRAPYRPHREVDPEEEMDACEFYSTAELSADFKKAPKNFAYLFKNFNPSFYEAEIEAFVNDPIIVTRSKDYYLDNNCTAPMHDDVAFVSANDISTYHLYQGKIFPSCVLDKKKSNVSGKGCRKKAKTNHSYWEVLSTVPTTVYHHEEDGSCVAHSNVIFIYDQEAIETRYTLRHEIQTALSNHGNYCYGP